MLVLYETPAGYALFKMDGKSIANPDSIEAQFSTPEKANTVLKLKAFQKFENTTDALSAVTALVEGKVSKNLKQFLTDEFTADMSEQLCVADTKLGSAIAKKLGIKVVSDAAVFELMRGIRSQLASLVTGLSETDMNQMVLGLSHSLSRYKLKFSPDKVDTMIIQAINLLDDLDKELNTYCMRAKEWYGWHFPEMTKIIADNIAYAKCVKTIGFRTNTSSTDLSSILPEDLESELKQAAEISMGTEISDQDIENIIHLCDQVIAISEYRAQLFDYLKNRMAAIAPNLTSIVGEIVGAKLIAHAGSLMSLAKYPASTVQILGAEKALFRALKTKHDTPKYGLIYHASLVGQAAPKLKGKIARCVATKAALSIRIDALGESEDASVGLEHRAKVEARLRQLEGKAAVKVNASAGKIKTPMKKFEGVTAKGYNASSDVVMTEPAATAASSSKKRKAEDAVEEVEQTEKKKAKKAKKEKKVKVVAAEEEPVAVVKKEKKSKKEK